MNKHTPGPWTIDVDHTTGQSEFIRAMVNDEMADIASLLCDETGAAEANARLIASAPSLYLALRELVTRCDGPEGVRADKSNICTLAAHAALGDFDSSYEQDQEQCEPIKKC